MAGGIDWFRWHHGSVTDPKFQLVAKKAGVSLPSVLAVWAYLLEKASAAEFRGCFGDLDVESVDCLFGFEEGDTDRILLAMVDRKLIADEYVVAWNNRQPKREREDNSAERVKALRQRQSQDQPTETNESHVTPCNASDDQKTPREEKRREEVNPSREPAGFAEFWIAYPKKVGKGAAESAWKKRKPSLPIVLSAIHAAKGSSAWLKDDGQFIPNPATWLNQKRWEDSLSIGGQQQGIPGLGNAL